jgi:thioredoxin-like negative regulator of GroEL
MGMSEEISSAEDFDRLVSRAKGSAVVVFHYPYCPYCVEFIPEFEKLAAGRPGFFRLRADLLGQIEDRHSVAVVPTVILFERGRESARLDGVQGRGLSASGLKNFLSARGF